ncbi:hypothetical protein A4A49_22240 [Nicotiana attenuata]|uniref:Uncharacterized protein n=1 Tax=Nicotiana attenuata TaxID=49451 RepID=A0A314KHG8_NICAT|nr:hypothetical protein A4A49_22240 [Nicotiana attenuata]
MRWQMSKLTTEIYLNQIIFRPEFMFSNTLTRFNTWFPVIKENTERFFYYIDMSRILIRPKRAIIRAGTGSKQQNITTQCGRYW